jgi:tetratricopeptide (TPR) repeat protein
MIGYIMLRSSRRIALLLASALLAGPARPALADPKPASAKDQKLASELVKKAIALAESGDHAGAIQLYNDANRVVPNVLLLPSIGAQYQELGQWDDALEYFCRYLKEDPNGVNVPFAKRSAKRAQQELGRKSADSRDPCAATGDAGDRRKIDDGGKRRSDDGEVKHRTDDGDARAKADDGEGKRKAKDPEARRKPDDGDGGVTAIESPPPSPPKPNGNAAVMYAGLAAGIAGIAAGGISVWYGLQGKSISDKINSHPPGTPWPDSIQQMQADGEHDNRAQIGYLIASGVLVATGVVLYVVGRPDATERGSEKAVVVAPSANGIHLFGRF